MNPPFRVRLWCSDCTGVDPQGCYDGGTELLREGRTFATLRAAVDAGYEETKDGAPRKFDVIDSDDEEIDFGEMTEAQINGEAIES